MLAAGPVASGVYHADGHFVPYAGAKPVAKGWNNKRGRAGRGHADTHVTAHDGRAVCFVSGEPSGLTVTLPKALAELRKAAGPGASIMAGFDRGGAYPRVFGHCRKEKAHWVTYRRAPLAVPAMLPVITTITSGGRTRQIAWAEETVRLKDYGDARQITLSEHGQVAPQILTSDFGACPADLLSWLKSRWREENFLASEDGRWVVGLPGSHVAWAGSSAGVIALLPLLERPVAEVVAELGVGSVEAHGLGLEDVVDAALDGRASGYWAEKAVAWLDAGFPAARHQGGLQRVLADKRVGQRARHVAARLLAP
jgi:hypothetical protein